MKVIHYTAKVLNDGHLSLQENVKKEMGLAVNSTVKITLEKTIHRDEAVDAFGVWSKEVTLKTELNMLRT
ncbi:MAG: hypothetical protein M8353_06130 [ANME-2 cluster archaeon]|nr:hypothetical protein [ANME-2 cluster archaeon]